MSEHEPGEEAVPTEDDAPVGMLSAVSHNVRTPSVATGQRVGFLPNHIAYPDDQENMNQHNVRLFHPETNRGMAAVVQQLPWHESRPVDFFLYPLSQPPRRAHPEEMTGTTSQVVPQRAAATVQAPLATLDSVAEASTAAAEGSEVESSSSSPVSSSSSSSLSPAPSSPHSDADSETRPTPGQASGPGPDFESEPEPDCDRKRRRTASPSSSRKRACRQDQKTRGDLVRAATDVTSFPFPSSYLREISSLASWTVNTHKPGCGVAALRHPSPDLFWQSDGPSPHILTLTFFKWVNIICMRLYVDHQLDESYTPTRISVWAGTALHDLQQVCDMPLRNPRGWVPVQWPRLGGDVGCFNETEVEDMEDCEEDGADEAMVLLRKEMRKAYARNGTLRCMLMQVRIIENHQNGKDTHLRGVQIFAKDEHSKRSTRRVVPSPKKKDRSRSGDLDEAMSEKKVLGVKEADWMGEPELR